VPKLSSSSSSGTVTGAATTPKLNLSALNLRRSDPEITKPAASDQAAPAGKGGGEDAKPANAAPDLPNREEGEKAKKEKKKHKKEKKKKEKKKEKRRRSSSKRKDGIVPAAERKNDSVHPATAEPTPV
jgi:hypothetical protein